MKVPDRVYEVLIRLGLWELPMNERGWAVSDWYCDGRWNWTPWRFYPVNDRECWWGDCGHRGCEWRKPLRYRP